MNKEEWSLYAEMQGVSKPILLNPLSWKNGNQVDNLKKILEFFNKPNITEKTKILIYHSQCGSGKCCDEDTLILTNKGIVRIEDIVKGNQIISQTTIEESFIGDTGNDNEQYIGSIVKSLNLNNIKFDDDIISNIFDMGDSNILDITTRSGFNIKCTPTHKLVTIDDNCNVMFKEAKDISTGDSIAIVCGTDIYGDDICPLTFYQSDFYHRHRADATKITIPDKMNEDIAELLGYAIAEGDKFGEGLTLRISGDEYIIRDRIKSIIDKLGICSYDIFDDKRNIDDGVAISFVIFKDFLRFLGYIDGSKNKEIPWSILRSSKKVQIAFLKALFSGDGYIGNENKSNIEYYTTSKRMAEQLHIMLLNMGIFTSLKEKAAICVKEDGERKDCGICYRISIFGRNDIIKYIDTIGFIQDYKKSRCIDMLNMFETKDFSYQSRTVKGSYIRLKRIYEEFKRLGKIGKIVKMWQEDVNLGNKIWKVNRSKKLSAMAALNERGFRCNIAEWINGSYSGSKRQILKLLKAMKECYYMEDFKYLYNIATSNIEFDTIEEKKEGISHVYDLTIRDNHSYVGNGFINHNSATLLHVIENMGRGIIVVPFRNLQRQYFDDYFTGKNKFVLKKNGQRLKVAVMLGRGNFPCRWLAEQYDLQQRMIKEGEKPENYGIIFPVDDNILRMYNEDPTCANKRLPCNRPLQSIGKGREVRWSVGCQCPYWIPTPMAKSTIDKWEDKEIDERKNDDFYEDEFEGENLPDIKKTVPDMNKSVKTQLNIIQDKIKCHRVEYYQSVGWGDTAIFIRDEVDKDGKPCPEVCPYYKQFYSYVYADCIVMNDAKWQLETMIGRKPEVSVEVSDEGDFWLDSRSVSLDFSRITIDKMLPTTNKMQRMKENTLFLFDTAFKSIKEKTAEQNKGKDINEISSIINSKNYRELFLSMTNMFLEYKKDVEEDDSILQRILDIYTVLKYIEKASISIKEKGGNKIISVFIPYPDNLLRELFDKSSKNIIITSGTIHSNFVLSNLFGINNDNYIVDFVEGRKESPGKLKCIKPKDGLLKVNHTNWQSPQFQMVYNYMLNYILDNLKIKIDQITGKPGEAKILVLTPAKKYAKGIINRPDVYVDFAKGNNEDEDNIKPAINTNLSDFMEKSIEDVRKIKPTDIEIDGDVLRTNQQIIVSTRMIRGADLRDNKCRAVVMTKWPFGDISAGYNQALKIRFGDKIYWSIAKDKAEREAIQYVSRGLRHELDWEFFSTPDEDAFNRVYMLFSYD